MNLIQLWKKRKQSSLLENTVMLYILQFTNMFLGLVTVPYQTRVLGVEIFGKLGIAAAVMMYFQLLMDFGFILSAVAKISTHRDDPKMLSKILSCVIWAKAFFFAVSLFIVEVFIAPTLPDNTMRLMYLLYLLSVATGSFLPDYMYRGLEKMSIITLRTVMIKLFFTVMIFLFLKTKDQYYMVPMFTAIGNAGAIAAVYWHLFRKMKIRFCRVSPKDVFYEIKDSFWFFVSKIASTVYSSSNTIILGWVDPTGGLSGAYSAAADKVITPARNMISPISDSLYPHMVKHKNFKLIKKVLLIFMPLIIAGCAVVFIFAEPLCTLFFGEEFRRSVTALRALLPVVVLTLPNYILGFPTLGAMGLAKYANLSTVFSSIVHVINLGIVFFTGHLSVLTLCLLISWTEFLLLIFRIVVIFLNRDRLRPDDEDKKGGEQDGNASTAA